MYQIYPFQFLNKTPAPTSLNISHPFNQEYDCNCPSTLAIYEVYQLSSTAASIPVPSCSLPSSSSSLPTLHWLVPKAECSVPVLQGKAAPARQPWTLSCCTGCTCTPLLFLSCTDSLKSHSLEMASHTVFPLTTKYFVRFLKGLVACALP